MRAHIALALAATLCTSALGISASAQTVVSRTVLTIYLGAETFPSNPVLDAAIRQTLRSRSGVRIDYFAEYFESDSFPGEQESRAFADYIRGKYQGRRIDLVIANTDTALRFVLDHREELFPAVPIVFAGLAAPVEISGRAIDRLTGIKVGAAYAETLNLALELQPSTERVFVVASGADNLTVGSVRATLDALSGRVSIVYLQESTVRGLLSAVKAIPPGSVILYIWHQPQREFGNALYADDVARLVAQTARVPVYGSSDYYIGTGIVGGVVRSTRDTGLRLGEMALRILTGTRPEDMPIEAAAVKPVIDWRQVQRWGIASSRVPATSQILFREPSVLERYTIYIVGALTILLIQGALIAGLLIHRAKRREAEQQMHRSQADLRRSYDRVRDLGARLLHAQERERSWIARELHDDISQQLAALTIELTLLDHTDQGRLEGGVHQAVRYAQEIGASVHALSHRLHPARLRLIGLVGALDGLRTELSHPDVHITFTHEQVPQTLPPDMALCLFRIVQEALHNALKHSGARTVSVDLRGVSGDIELTIVDDGVGFEVEASLGAGLGLISVRERVEAIGGTLGISSGSGAGTRLHVLVKASILQAQVVAL